MCQELRWQTCSRSSRWCRNWCIWAARMSCTNNVYFKHPALDCVFCSWENTSISTVMTVTNPSPGLSVYLNKQQKSGMLYLRCCFSHLQGELLNSEAHMVCTMALSDLSSVPILYLSEHTENKKGGYIPWQVRPAGLIAKVFSITLFSTVVTISISTISVFTAYMMIKISSFSQCETSMNLNVFVSDLMTYLHIHLWPLCFRRHTPLHLAAAPLHPHTSMSLSSSSLTYGVGAAGGKSIKITSQIHGK